MAQPAGKLGPYIVDVTVEYIPKDLQIRENVEELVKIVGHVLYEPSDISLCPTGHTTIKYIKFYPHLIFN
jgi:hypothetical protein